MQTDPSTDDRENRTEMISEKTLRTLEFEKILERLASHTSFSASKKLAHDLFPTTDYDEAKAWQEEVTEVRDLMEKNEHRLNMGGVRDVRDPAIGALRGVVIEPNVLLDIRMTLRRAETLQRSLGKMQHQYPLLAEIVSEIQPCTDLQTTIDSAIDDNGEVRDTASPRLAMIRRDLKVTFDRLQTKLNKLISNPGTAQYLQENIITMRNGRYVVPVKADFKGRVRGILHDTSSSGATIFVEPENTVELNNEWRDLQLQEEKEIRRILAAITEAVAGVSEDVVRTVDVLSYLDLVKAKAEYAEQLGAIQPIFLPFKPHPDYPEHPGSTVYIEQARHPLIPGKVVPIDIDFGEDTWSLVITGPNTGGKTVALKNVGLMSVMAQCGMHLPCVEAKLSVFTGIYADIGDEQSIEQSLSTFSAHMTNTIRILDECDDHSLVLLDEVGAGTDPAEGSALARAIMNHLVDRRATTMVTTHHPELKNYAVETEGVRNASMEFDLETLSPTYRLIIGLPGRSNALAIAERLGLDDMIIEDAKTMVSSAELDAEKLLNEIHRSREGIRQREMEIEAIQEDMAAERDELRERLDKLEDERRDVLVTAQRKAENEVEELRKEIKRLRNDMRSASLPLENLKAIQETADRLVEYTRQPVEEGAIEVPPAESDGWRPRLGDTVWLETLKAEGQVVELDEEEAMVQVGTLKVRVGIHDIRRPNRIDKKIAEKEQSKRRRGRQYKEDRPVVESPGLELDLRGQRVEGALQKLDEYIDTAYLSGLPFARIIHGKGTGALRKAVREVVDGHPLVSKVTAARPNEGGDGVTIIHMAPLR
ncbi:MAG: endonuclease MutS2 [Chloroflexota bacterium]